MSDHREERALQEFKQTLSDLLGLLRGASAAETAWICWVNHERLQFVIECNRTLRNDLTFRDRIPFQDSFLYELRDRAEPVRLEMGQDLLPAQLEHHPDASGLYEVWIVPYVNNGETVSLTVLEFSSPADQGRVESGIRSYARAFGGILHTWLELMDLHQGQQGWVEYDRLVQELSPRMHRAELLIEMANRMQQLLPTGAITLVTKGTGAWMTSFNTSSDENVPLLGTMLDEKSLAYDALQAGESRFAIHFNQSPRRVSATEEGAEGATLAIPLMIHDHRQAAILAYDRNALAFTESLKHQLSNLVRVAGLSMQAWMDREQLSTDLFANEHGSLLPDLWERTLEQELSHPHSQVTSWFGLVSIENIQEIRTAHRLESLKKMQSLLVGSLAPHRFGRTGLIGFHSDYVYAFLLQDRDPEAIDSWLKSIQSMVSEPVRISSEESVTLSLKAGYTSLQADMGRDRHRVVQQAKQALSEAIRSRSMSIEYGRAADGTTGFRE